MLRQRGVAGHSGRLLPHVVLSRAAVAQLHECHTQQERFRVAAEQL